MIYNIPPGGGGRGEKIAYFPRFRGKETKFTRVLRHKRKHQSERSPWIRRLGREAITKYRVAGTDPSTQIRILQERETLNLPQIPRIPFFFTRRGLTGEAARNLGRPSFERSLDK